MAARSVLDVVAHDLGRFAQAVRLPPYLPSILPVVLGVVVVAYVVVDGYGSLDAREPPKLRPSLPLVGHLMGMFVRHTRYFEDL